MSKTGVLGLIVLILMVANWAKIKHMGASVFPVKYVRVGGQFENLQEAKIKQQLLPLVNTSFFTVDLQVLHATVGAIPWVDKVEVKRVWPDTIEILIKEQQARARWGQDSLLNKRGEVFTPANAATFEALPVIVGRQGQARKLYKIMREFKLGLLTSGMQLAELEINERQSWNLVFANGINLQLGRKQPIQKFWQLLTLLPVLGYDKLELIKVIDMRYPNGISILWKSDVTINWQQLIPGAKVPG